MEAEGRSIMARRHRRGAAEMSGGERTGTVPMNAAEQARCMPIGEQGQMSRQAIAVVRQPAGQASEQAR